MQYRNNPSLKIEQIENILNETYPPLIKRGCLESLFCSMLFPAIKEENKEEEEGEKENERMQRHSPGWWGKLPYFE